MERYDLAVLGGGTAGLVTAAGGALLGARVILFERDRLGGDCLWTGCVPTKSLIRSAKVYHLARHGELLGLPPLAAAADFAQVMERMRRVRAAIEPHDSPERFRGLGVDVALEPARLEARGRVSSASRQIEARRIVIATGSRAAAPPIPGLEDTGYLTHVEALERDHLPASILILGGGAIGLEFAQLYARFGVSVTVMEREPQLLPQAADPEIAEALRRVLELEGIRVLTGVAVSAAERAADGRKRLRAGQEWLAGEEIFVATGRRPNVEGMGLAEAGVAVAPGGVVVDDTLRTSQPAVFAAGDVTGKHLFTHMADYQARLVVANALVPLLRRRADYSAVPWVIFTDPEVAGVGLSEAEAGRRYGNVQVFRYGFEDLDRAIIDGQAQGIVKLVADRRGRLLGAQMIAPDAGSLIASPIVALRARLRLGQLAGAVHPYPTLPEGVRKAAETVYRQKLEGAGGRLLRRLVRLRSVR